MREDDEVREIEVEIIRPGEKAPPKSAPPPPPLAGKATRTTASAEGADAAGFDDPFVAFVSKLMDTVFVVPGTNIRFGFDPLIGLIPGIGDTASAVTSLMLILQSSRHGLPRIVLTRMVLNVLINAGVGGIPVVGDLFSFWFQSNARNYELLRKHARPQGASTKPDWFFVILLIVGSALALTLVFAAAIAWFQIAVNLLNGMSRQPGPVSGG